MCPAQGTAPRLSPGLALWLYSMKQLSFHLPKPSKEHGGSLALNKRRSYRPLSIKHAHHITLKSNLATQGRCLLRHQALIKHILFRSARRFNIRVYQYAVAGNHVHLLVKAKSRLGMQNFFRVFAGHLAQEILRRCPVVKPPSRPLRVGQRSSSFVAGGASTSRGCRPACLKNQRRFWGYLVYSRVLTWGREYRLVKLYIIQNMLEALGVIAYTHRSPQHVAGRLGKASTKGGDSIRRLAGVVMRAM